MFARLGSAVHWSPDPALLRPPDLQNNQAAIVVLGDLRSGVSARSGDLRRARLETCAERAWRPAPSALGDLRRARLETCAERGVMVSS